MPSSKCLKRWMFAAAFWGTVSQLPLGVDAHIAPWHKGMYCLNGTTGVDNQNTNEAVNPLYMLKRSDWWMHHVNRCDQFPPAPGDFLELPARGSFVVELAMNRAFTSLSYNSRMTAAFGHGQDQPTGKSADGCIFDPNLHTKSEEGAAGTAFAISYHSNIADVTPENLVVFSVLYHTPWRRIAEYHVPDLPACPTGGCHCAWGWVPNGCGEPNMYMLPFKCKVVGQTGSRAVAPAIPPVYCENNKNRCVRGAKQMVFWNQLEGNNINSPPNRAPMYNERLGFVNGAQHDIFLRDGTAQPTSLRVGPLATIPGYSPPRPTEAKTSAGAKLDALPVCTLIAIVNIIFATFL